MWVWLVIFLTLHIYRLAGLNPLHVPIFPIALSFYLFLCLPPDFLGGQVIFILIIFTVCYCFQMKELKLLSCFSTLVLLSANRMFRHPSLYCKKVTFFKCEKLQICMIPSSTFMFAYCLCTRQHTVASECHQFFDVSACHHHFLLYYHATTILGNNIDDLMFTVMDLLSQASWQKGSKANWSLEDLYPSTEKLWYALGNWS